MWVEYKNSPESRFKQADFQGLLEHIGKNRTSRRSSLSVIALEQSAQFHTEFSFFWNHRLAADLMRTPVGWLGEPSGWKAANPDILWRFFAASEGRPSRKSKFLKSAAVMYVDVLAVTRFLLQFQSGVISTEKSKAYSDQCSGRNIELILCESAASFNNFGFILLQKLFSFCLL